MIAALFWILLFSSIITIPAVLVFSLEILFSRDIGTTGDPALAPAYTVLVPAHNEAGGIAETVAHLLPQIREQDRLLVVADNCHDDTAVIARTFGAFVTERNEPTRRGKGYALAHGIQHAANWDTPVIIIVDADCRISDGGLSSLAAQVARTQRPVQGSNTITVHAGAARSARFSAFAFRVKNHARALGAARLGIPCLLTGTGMAIPKEAFPHVNVGSGELAEDLLLAIDLALAGFPASFCPQAKIVSPLPQDEKAAAMQRQRWEQGYLSIMRRFTPRLFAAGIKKANFRLIALGLDVAIPPLSLLSFALFASSILSLGITLAGGSLVLFALTSCQLGMFGMAVLMAWSRYGRDLLSGADVIALPITVLRKLGFYVRIVRAPQQEWVRTARDAGGKSTK